MKYVAPIGRALVTGAAIAFAAMPVLAQTPPPAGRPPLEGPLMARYLAAEQVGGCVVRNKPKVAQLFVLAGGGDRSDPASNASELRYAAVPCLKGEFRSVHLDGLEMRGAMAEALLKEHNAALLLKARSTPPHLAERIAPLVEGINLALFGCAVAAMPAQAAALLDAAPSTSGEASAFAAIEPALQGCAPADAALHIKPSAVRWLVATSLYRLVETNPGT
ncbi:hypothetical protein KZX46_14505 [Polymorphobacter sp. PAMC 29334]|uniref:hypothetical protein n=1 Tax=Polymorphobacter sp. PAMC 29334 TaxID=2862331 RepID=UPI001C77522E|nr:hypothetical protein [Polymorphobacter sp. PAMC 29334]QYE34017.1 hypothetical protein KZX46_14505 [Polymorphobacter sp. PAMC 29334]